MCNLCIVPNVAIEFDIDPVDSLDVNSLVQNVCCVLTADTSRFFTYNILRLSVRRRHMYEIKVPYLKQCT